MDKSYPGLGIVWCHLNNSNSQIASDAKRDQETWKFMTIWQYGKNPLFHLWGVINLDLGDRFEWEKLAMTSRLLCMAPTEKKNLVLLSSRRVRQPDLFHVQLTSFCALSLFIVHLKWDTGQQMVFWRIKMAVGWLTTEKDHSSQITCQRQISDWFDQLHS